MPETSRLAVGYDLYCKLLNEAVLALRGEKEAEDFETVVDCDIDAYIPPSYIRNEYQKLDVYKRISGIENQEEYLDMPETSRLAFWYIWIVISCFFTSTSTTPA